MAADDGAHTANKDRDAECRPGEDKDAPPREPCEGSSAKNDDRQQQRQQQSRNGRGDELAPPPRPWHRGQCQEEALRWRRLRRRPWDASDCLVGLRIRRQRHPRPQRMTQDGAFHRRNVASSN